MKYSTKAIFGKINLGVICEYDLINWGEEMLMADYDSPSLRILAGLPYYKLWDQEGGEYFWRSIEELRDHIEIPTVEEGIIAYVRETTQKITDDQLIFPKSNLTSCHLVVMTLSNIYDSFLSDDFYFLNYSDSDYEKIWLELSNILDNILKGDLQSFILLENYGNEVKQKVITFLAKMESYN